MITIDRRFCGPPTSANGGYACGLAAAQLSDLPEPVEVTLRSPPPLDTPIEVERVGNLVLLRHDERTVAEAVRAPLTLQPPAPVPFDEATQAARGYPWRDTHPFPGCFVCGPDRAEGDGLRIFPGAVAGRELAAAPWVPPASFADAGGLIVPEIVWAALDCPSWFGAACFHPTEGRPLLGRLTAAIHSRPRAGDRCVCVGWFIGRRDRKVQVGSALFGADGTLHALGQAIWILVA
ncbi:MAG TPA: hypothetical protein VM734_07435 [Kofleriaceae bacterium]|nr:hypothetical protein [Kofleriaceae bacterium]